MDGRIGDHTGHGDLARPASNCGLTSSTIGDPGWHSDTSTGMTTISEMNDRSATTRSTSPPIVSGGGGTDVEALEHDDAWVVADPRVQLAVADVERDHRRAPRCSRQSVKPPVDAPASSAASPATSMSKRRARRRACRRPG